MAGTLLHAKNLTVDFSLTEKPFSGRIRAVHNVSFSIGYGEVLGLVGESGCGKSTLAKTIAGLLKPSRGEIYFMGQRKPYGKFSPQMQMVFQDSQEALNARMRVVDLVGEGLIIQGVKRDKVNKLVMKAIEDVRLTRSCLHRYPHEFSGGQRQRIALARALILKPKMLILDEPTSALDVTVQAQIMALLASLKNEYSLSYLLISHNLAVVRHLCTRVFVMYTGKIVEEGNVDSVFSSPRHFYTQMLLEAHPSPDPLNRAKLRLVIGEPPNPISPPTGCSFHPRCAAAVLRCKYRQPPLVESGLPGHKTACHFYDS